MLFDLGADLLVPPLSKIGLWIVVGVPASAVTGGVAIVPWSAAALMMGAYVARGVQLTRLGPRAVLDLAWAPVYVVWKLGLSASGQPSAWVRTTREKPQ